MRFAQQERDALCDLMWHTGPDAATLCEGWDVHDLACHLWIRETDPLGVPGMFVAPLSDLTDRRMTHTRDRWPFGELVERLRRGPSPMSLFAIPGVDEAANAIEYFVHHEDVRRAGANPLAPRDLPDDIEELWWRRLRLMAAAFYRSSPVGVMLVADGEEIRAKAGTPLVSVHGRPSELLLFTYGRRDAADVDVRGDDDSVRAFAAA